MKKKKQLLFSKITILLFFILNIAKSYGQDFILKGQVKDSASNILSSASVYLISSNETITKFDVSDDKGQFKFLIANKDIDNLKWIEVSHSGYKTQRKVIDKSTQIYDFTLLSDPDMLKEVIVKNIPPISSMGDTLRYNVNKFADKNDRSIGDVLKRMPGVSINDDDGTIYFNGKKISNLYIDGDDLMSARYKLATDAINKDMIESVDVMKNHQPINVLKDKIFSDATALNLVLRDPNSFKVSGNVNVGAGVPRQYDISVTPIILNQRIKAVDNVALNNIGISYDNQVKTIGAANFISSIENKPPDLKLSLGTKTPSDLPQPSYFFNNSGIINLNNIYKTKNDIQFKLNLQALVDKNQGSYNAQTINYLTNDTILYSENQNYANTPSKLNGILNMLINKKKYFFTNTTSVTVSNEKNTGSMQFNDSSFNQRIDKHLVNISNDINWIPTLGNKNIGEFRWLINYNQDKQDMKIADKFYSNIPDQPLEYDGVLQHLQLPVLSSHLYINYKIPGKIINQTYTTGYIGEYQKLNTGLEFTENNSNIAYSGDKGNDLHWNKNNVYISSNYQVNYKKLRSFINLPLTYQNIYYYQTEYGLNTRTDKLFFNPEVNINYNLTNEQSFNGIFRVSNILGDLTGIYRGGILQDYRSFTSNDAALQETRKETFSFGYNMQKTVKMFFANIGVDYNNIKAENLTSIVTKENLQTTISIPFENRQKELVLKGGISKYLFAMKSTIALQASLVKNKASLAINGDLQPYTSSIYSVNGSFGKKLYDKLSFTYSPMFLWTTSKSERQNADYLFSVKGFHLNQIFGLTMAPTEKFDFKIMARHSYNSQSGNTPTKYFFMDAACTYRKIKRCDVSLNVTNLFNVKEFIIFNSNSYQTYTGRFNLRGRTGVLRVSYYF